MKPTKQERFQQLLWIANAIRIEKCVTMEQLEAELDVSRKTIHRAISALRKAGFPIYFDTIEQRYNWQHNVKLPWYIGGDEEEAEKPVTKGKRK